MSYLVSINRPGMYLLLLAINRYIKLVAAVTVAAITVFEDRRKSVELAHGSDRSSRRSIFPEREGCQSTEQTK